MLIMLMILFLESKASDTLQMVSIVITMIGVVIISISIFAIMIKIRESTK